MPSSPQFHYQVACPCPAAHFFVVTLTVTAWQADKLDLKMPVWTPGSYLVREYSRHLQQLVAQGEKHQSLAVQKLSKNHWQVDTELTTTITVSYRVYADELSVRTNHLDASHGYFNGAALFLAIAGYEKQPLSLEIIPPHPHWLITTALTPTTESSWVYSVPDFDTLVDSPVEMGEQSQYQWQVLGKAHQLTVWGTGNLNPQQLLADLTKIIATEAQIFGGLPYDKYTFILHLSSQGFGGLEHKNCCSLNYNRFGFRETEKYQRFLQLVAHEFFHLWNVKRLRPIALENFDYYQENYTPSLWFAEGTTSYYDLIIPLRAKIYDSSAFLGHLSKEISRYLLTPGRHIQPLAESSFDAWTKLYRREAHSDNCQISYYLKGELLTLMLDLLIRDHHNNQRSFDDVLSLLWQKFGQSERGFTEQELEETIATVAQKDLTDFWERYLYGLVELPLAEYLEPFGLTLKPIFAEEPTPYLGLKVQTEQGQTKVKFVAAHSPSEKIGFSVEDELVALNGLRVTAEQLNSRLQDFRPQDWLEVTFFHQDILKTASVQLGESQPLRYEVIPLSAPSPRQVEQFKGWLEG